MRAVLIPALSFALLLAPNMAQAGNDNGYARTPPQAATAESERQKKSPLHLFDRSAGVQFTATEREVILRWFADVPTTTEQQLPPGLAKQLHKRGSLPPGLSGRALPPGLAKKLGPAPKGYERVIVDRDVVLVNSVTGAIVDILRGVIRR